MYVCGVCMKATIWIRKENEEAWARLGDKSAFVNIALQTDGHYDAEMRAEIREAMSGSALPDVAKGAPIILCKHNRQKGYCVFGCK